MVGRKATDIDAEAMAEVLLNIFCEIDHPQVAMNSKADPIFRLEMDASGMEFANHVCIERYYDVLMPLLLQYPTPPPRLAVIIDCFYIISKCDSSLYGASSADLTAGVRRAARADAGRLWDLWRFVCDCNQRSKSVRSHSGKLQRLKAILRGASSSELAKLSLHGSHSPGASSRTQSPLVGASLRASRDQSPSASAPGTSPRRWRSACLSPQSRGRPALEDVVEKEQHSEEQYDLLCTEYAKILSPQSPGLSADVVQVRNESSQEEESEEESSDAPDINELEAQQPVQEGNIPRIAKAKGTAKAKPKAKPKGKAIMARPAAVPGPQTMAKPAVEPGPWVCKFSEQRENDIFQLFHMPTRRVIMQIQRPVGTEMEALKRASALMADVAAAMHPGGAMLSVAEIDTAKARLNELKRNAEFLEMAGLSDKKRQVHRPLHI